MSVLAKTLSTTALALSTSVALASASAQEVTSCGGTEPFWDLDIGPKQIQLRELGDRTMTMASRPAGTARGYTADFLALYQGKVIEEEGRYMNVMIKRASCSDGMSDIDYPFEVLVLSGTELLRGCCF
jgi:uncharacterized membrane protein